MTAPKASALWRPYALGVLAVFLCAFEVYSPSLHGGFVFDDFHMPYMNRAAPSWPFSVWLGVRPLLMTTYWANLKLSGVRDTFPYHAVNVFFHASAAVFLFLAVRRVLESARVTAAKIIPLAAFASGIFLLHPIQTEAVSYIAQRGEDLGALIYFSAFCVFLYRPPGPISWSRTAAILALFGCAVTAKEHTVTLPALLFLTDWFFNPGFSFEGVKRNRRLYLAFAVGFLAAVAFVWRYVRADTLSVGFSLPEFTAPQYLFTQFRVFFAYLGLYLFPFRQTIDYDFDISRTLLDRGSILALALILALVAAAFRYRRRFPLAAYGLLVFIVLLLPTSSIVPIKDPIADRRLYLPIIGLIFISIDFLRRWNVSRPALIATCSAVCLLLGIASYRRNEKWNSAVDLWADAAEKAPRKSRIQFGLAVAEYLKGRCADSIAHYLDAIALSKPDFQLYMNLGVAYDCNRQSDKAAEALKKSIALKPTAQSWATLALVEAKQGQFDQPLADLLRAQTIDPAYPQTFYYRGRLFQAVNRNAEAADQYRWTLVLDPGNAAAREALNSLPH